MFSAFRHVTARYSSLEAWGYDRLVGGKVVGPLLRLPVVERTVSELPATAALLDVGCGGGHLLLTIAQRCPQLALTGIDLSADQIQRARLRAQRLPRHVRFDQGNALNLPYADEAFDCVISVTSIKHWPDRARGAAEILRVLKSGGRWLIAEVDRDATTDDATAFLRDLGAPRVLSRFAARPFCSFVLATGWNINDARRFASLSFPIVDEVSSAARPPVVIMTGRKR